MIDGLPAEVLNSEEIRDLPPSYFCVYELPGDKRLTPDQKAYYLELKGYWLGVYAALERFHQGKPVALPELDKYENEYLIAVVDRCLALYRVINFGWDWLNEKMINLPPTPGATFLDLLAREAIIDFLPCFENSSFSPQKVYREREKKLKGEIPLGLSEAQLEWMRPNIAVLQWLALCDSPTVKKALREYAAAFANVAALDQKRIHPRKGIKGWQWADGKRVESTKHRRHKNNQKTEYNQPED